MSLGGDETETSWQSTLEQAPQLVLKAPEGRPWSEVWRLSLQPDLVLLRDGAAARRADRGRRLRARVPALAERDADGGARPPAGSRGPDADDRRRVARGHARPKARARQAHGHGPQQPRAAARAEDPEGGRGPGGQGRRPGPARAPRSRRAAAHRPRGPSHARGPLAAGPRHGRLLRPAARLVLEPRGQRHAAAHAAARALAPRGARSRLGPGRALLVVSRVPARRGRRPRPHPREPAHDHAVGPARAGPERAPGDRGARRGRLRLRACAARQAAAAERPRLQCASAPALRLGAREPRPALRRDPAGPALPAGHAGGRQRQHRHALALVRRPRQRRRAGRGRPEPAALALPRADAALGALARGGPGARLRSRPGAPSAKAASGARSCCARPPAEGADAGAAGKERGRERHRSVGSSQARDRCHR